MATIKMSDIYSTLSTAEVNISNTAELLNAIRAELGGAYALAVPTADDRNIGEVGIGINSLLQHKNDFLNQLIDRIGLVVIKHKSLKNPLGKF